MLPTLLLLLSCAEPTGDTGDPCADVPLVNWDNFGQGFIIEACQGCHASTAQDRHGAPQAVHFDTVDDVWLWRPQVLDRAAPVDGDPTMPPAGGTDPDDRTRLRWWLDCADYGT